MERSSRGRDCQVTCELDAENQGCLVSIHPWNVHSAHHYHDESHLQGHDLESNMLLRPSGLETWLNLYITFKILEGRDGNLSCDAQDIPNS